MPSLLRGIFINWLSIMPYSAIHKAAVPKKTTGHNTPQRPFLLAAPIDSQWTLFHSTGIVPVKIMEQPGTMRPAALWIARFTKPLSSILLVAGTTLRDWPRSRLKRFSGIVPGNMERPGTVRPVALWIALLICKMHAEVIASNGNFVAHS